MDFTPHEFVKAAVGLLPADLQAAGPTNGTGVDCATFHEALVVLHAGAATGAATLDVHVEDSADNVTFADITGAVFTQIVAANDNTIYVGRINLKKCARYIRAVAVGDGANAILAGVSFILFGSRTLPVTQVNTTVFNV